MRLAEGLRDKWSFVCRRAMRFTVKLHQESRHICTTMSDDYCTVVFDMDTPITMVAAVTRQPF